MAANIEYQLLTKILETQSLTSVQRLKIDSSYFYSPEAKMVFDYIWNHAHSRETYGSVPSFQLVQSIFKAFPYSPSSDTLETLCEQVRLSKMRGELTEACDRIFSMANHNPREGLKYINQLAAKLNNRHEITHDLMLSNIYDDFLKEYELVASGQGVTGYHWPWQLLNEATQGIHDGNFYVIYGRPKSMKTWISLYIVTYLNTLFNRRVLIYSAEMPPKQILRRVAAIRCAIDYKRLLSGTLPPEERDRFFNQLRWLRDGEGEYGTAAPLLVTSGGGNGGVSYLKSKIRDFEPHIVLVDGMYLLKDDRQGVRTMDWKAIAHISQDLKNTATEFNIPIIGVGQANKKAEKNAVNGDLTDIAYSDALAQDCDFSIRVQKRKDPSTQEPELVLAFPGVREADIDAFLVHGIPAVNFTFKSEFVSEEGQADEGDSKQMNGHNNESRTIPQEASQAVAALGSRLRQ